MLVQNPQTGLYEDDGAALVRPLTGAPIDTAPDQVQPSDLIVGSDPRHPYAGAIPLSGRAVPVGPAAPTPPGQGGAPMIPISGRSIPVGDGPDLGGVKPAKFVDPFPVAGDAGAGAPGAPPAPAPKPIDVGPTIETSSTKISKEAQAGQADQLAALKERGGLVEENGTTKVENARETAALVQKQATDKLLAADQDKQDRAALKDKYDAAMNERDRIIADAEKKNLTGYFETASVGAKALAALAVIGGGIGAAIGNASSRRGTPQYQNEGIAELDKVIARDTALKQQKLKAAIEDAGMKGVRAREAFDMGMQEINLRKSVLYDKLADEKASMDALHGVDAASAETKLAVNELRMKAGALREEFGHFADQKIRTSNELQQRARLAQAEAGAKTENLALRGTDGQPIQVGTANGQAVYAEPHDKEAAKKIADFRDKLPTLTRNLDRLQQIASAPASVRAKAVASGEVKALRHEIVTTYATEEGTGKISARLIKEAEAMIPDVGLATLRDPGKVLGQARERMVQRGADVILANTNANASAATRIAQDWAGGAAGREGRRIKYRLPSGQVVDAIQRPDGTVEAVQ